MCTQTTCSNCTGGGTYCRLCLSDKSVSLQLFNIAAIIGLIPVYDRVFVPLLHRFGKKLTLLQRIGAHVSGPSSALFYPACCDDAFSLANSTLLRLCIKDCAVFPTPKQL